MTMRYLIHLLPEESRRTDLDDLRARLAEHIGWNKALDYPTAHITMVYDIQDAKNDAHPIDRVRLQLALDRFDGTGPIEMSLQLPALFEGRHLLMIVDPTAPLTSLRHSIFRQPVSSSPSLMARMSIARRTSRNSAGPT